MLSLAHTLVSLPFGVFLDNPVIIFVAAFLFHLVCDALLHWNVYEHHRAFPVWVAIDIFSGILVAWLFVGDQLLTLPILAAIAGGNAPDVIQGLWDFLPKHIQKKKLQLIKPFFDFHFNVQLETKNAAKGLLSQIVLIMIAILAIL